MSAPNEDMAAARDKALREAYGFASTEAWATVQALSAVAYAIADLTDAVREGNRPVTPPRVQAKPYPTDICTCGHTRAEHHLARGYPHAPCRVIGCACLDYEATP